MRNDDLHFVHIYICLHNLHLFTLFVASDDQKFVGKPNSCELLCWTIVIL